MLSAIVTSFNLQISDRTRPACSKLEHTQCHAPLTDTRKHEKTRTHTHSQDNI